MEKPLYIKFDVDGIVNMYSEQPRPYHIIINDIPKDFKGSEDIFEIDFDNEGMIGVKRREDLKEYLIKKAEKKRLFEEELILLEKEMILLDKEMDEKKTIKNGK